MPGEKGTHKPEQGRSRVSCTPSCEGEHCSCSDRPDFFLTLMLPCYLLKLRAQEKSLISNIRSRLPLNDFEVFLDSQSFFQHSSCSERTIFMGI